MSEFRARLASVRATPSRADDVRTVTRVMLEAHDIPVDPLVGYLGEDVRVTITTIPPPLLPLDEALEELGEAEDHGTNGTGEVAVARGRRRRGTRSSEAVEA
jgi:hypothetical protein